MKTFQLFCIALLTIPVSAAQLEDVILPAKTEIFIVLGQAIDSKASRTGDRFHGKTTVPVTLNDQIVIPEGSYILGTVEFAETAGRVKGKAHLRLLFDTVILPDGVTRKMEAVVQSAEGQQGKPGDERGTLEGKGNQTGDTAGGAAAGGVAGAGVGAIAGGWSGAGIGSAIGAASGAIIGLLKRGEEVRLPRGTAVTIQIEAPIRFVLPSQSSQP